METVEDLLGPPQKQTVEDLLGPPDISQVNQGFDQSYQRDLAAGATPYSYPISVPPSLNPDWDIVRETKGQPALMLAGKAADVIGKKVIGPVASTIINRLHAATAPETELLTQSPEKTDTAEAGVPMLNLPKLTPQEKEAAVGWEKELAGVGEGLAGVYEGLSTPEAVATLPFVEAKPIAAMYGAQMGASLPESLQALNEATTPEEKAKAYTSMALNLGMTGLMAHSLMTEGGPRASNNKEAAAVYGDVRAQPRKGARQVPAEEGGGGVQSSAEAEETPVSLTPEHQALVDPYLDKYNIAIKDRPFTGRVAQASHETGQIHINKGDFELWLNRDLKNLSPEEKSKAIQSLFDHEDIHLKTDPEDAEPFWNSLSPFEKWVTKRNYLKGIRDDTPRNLGFEAIRNRMEKAMGMTQTDFIGMTRLERWTAKSLDFMSDIVSKIRGIHDKELSTHQKSILDKVQANLDAARNVIVPGAGYAPGPFMQRRAEEPEEGTTRLWRGHDGNTGGVYWTSDKTYAQRMGSQLESLDVPTDRLGDYSVRKVEGSGTPNAYKLPPDMTKAAQTSEPGEMPVHDLGPAMMRRPDGTPEDDLESPLPPVNPGERVVFIRRPDGSIYRAAFGGKTYDVSAGGKAMLDKYGKAQVESVARVNERGQWSHGLLAPGERIIKGYSPYAAVERSGGPEGPAMMRKADDGQKEMDFNAGKPVKASSGIEYQWPYRFQAWVSPSGEFIRGESGETHGKLATQHLKKLGVEAPSDMRKLYDEMENRGYVRVIGLGSSGGIHFDSPLNPKQEGALKNIAIEHQLPLTDRTGNFLYRPDEGPAMMRKKGKAGEEPELFGAPITQRGIPGGEDVQPTSAAEAGAVKQQVPLKVWPQEIDWQEGSKSEDKLSLPVRPITPTEAKNPAELKKFLTEDARRGGSDLPVSFTRRVTVLFDKNDGSVHVVSTYPGDGTVRMVDPKEAGSSRPNKPIEDLLSRYQPISSILLREPRQNFHQEFESMEDFMGRFGDEAKQLYRQNFTGLGGLPGAQGEKFAGRTRESQPEYTGLREEGKPVEEGVRARIPKAEREPTMERPSADELRTFHDFVGEEIPSSPEQLDRRLHRTAATAPRQAINVLRKLVRLEMQTHRGFSPGAALENVLDQLYENLKNTDTRQGFVARTMAQLRTRIAEEVPKGGGPRKTGARELTVQDFLGPKQPPSGTGVELPEGVPPVPPEMLSPEDRKLLEAEIDKEHNVLTPERSAELLKSIAASPVSKERYTVGGTKSLADFDVENPDPDIAEIIEQEDEEAEAAKNNPELFPERQLMSEKPDVEVSQPELVTKAARPDKGRTKGESGMRQALERAESTKRQETLDLGKRADEPKGEYEFPQRKLVREIRGLRDQLLSSKMDTASLEEKNDVRNSMLRKIVEYENQFGEFPWSQDKGPAMMRRAEKVKEKAADVATAFLRGAHAIKSTISRSGTVDAIAATRDRADNEGNLLGDQVQKNIELNTFGNKDRKQVGQIKASANAVLSSGAFKPVYKFEGEALDRYHELFENDPQYKALQGARSSEDPEMKTNAGKAAAGIHKRVVSTMRDENTLPPPSEFKFQPQAKNKLDSFLAKAEKGIRLADQMIKEGNFIARNVGRKWKAAAEAMRDEVQYAKDHWGEEEMMGTALDMRKELEGQFQREKNAGYNIRYDDNYLPGRYQAEFFNDNSVVFPGLELLGRQFAKGKTFKTYYDAIANGPYIPATRDGAAIVGSRVRSGTRQLNKLAWMESLKMIKDPESPGTVATNPKKTSDGKFSPSSPAHELLEVVKGRDPISVRKSYLSLIKNLSGYSDIKNFAPAWRTLQLAQKLKHTMLAFDFFHLGKMKQFDWSLNAFGNSGHRNALSALEYRPQDLQRAVDKGAVSPSEAKWATDKVDIKLKNGNTVSLARREIADLMIRQGLNVGRIQDAIYKDMVAQWPIIGRYNKFLFDEMTRGIMLNTAVRHFELYNKTHSSVGTSALARDIAKDVNNRFASIGRQGWIKNPTYQDIFRTFGLAPQWWEGLLKTELTGYSRASGLSYAMGRRNLPYLGVAGKSMGRGLATLFLTTQAINMLTRGKPTWENDEEGHKFDAWIPDFHGGDGFFISPLSVFNELTHDITRMYGTKPTVMDELAQIGYNKLGPMGRFLTVLGTGKTPSGQQTTTSMNRLEEAVKQLIPVPITLGKAAQYAGNKLAPGVIPKPSTTDIERQALSSVGIKAEPAPSAGLQMVRKSDEFLKANGLKRDTGYDLTPTDEASYAKLRSAIRNGDERSAQSLLKDLRKTRSNDDIVKAMNIWANRPFTGSNEKETLMIQQMPKADLDLYSKAMIDREHVLDSFNTFMVKNDDGKD